MTEVTPDNAASATPVYVATAPERIFLQVADDDYYAEDPFPTGQEITWCADSVMELEVAYVREDLHAATVTALEAEVERLRSALLRVEAILGPSVHLYDTTSDMARALEVAASTLTGASAK